MHHIVLAANTALIFGSKNMNVCFLVQMGQYKQLVIRLGNA